MLQEIRKKKLLFFSFILKKDLLCEAEIKNRSKIEDKKERRGEASGFQWNHFRTNRQVYLSIYSTYFCFYKVSFFDSIFSRLSPFESIQSSLHLSFLRSECLGDLTVKYSLFFSFLLWPIRNRLIYKWGQISERGSYLLSLLA